jgi:hypothetical protein
VWAGAVAIYTLFFYILPAKAFSAAMLSQQEKNNTEDVQRGRANITGFM